MEPPNQDDAAHPEPPQASPGGAASPSRIPKKTMDAAPAANAIDSKLPSGLPPPQPPTMQQPPRRQGSYDDGGRLAPLVLPDGVSLPPSVTPDMLDGRLRRSFLDLAPTQMKEVLAEYDEAVREKGSEIRNRNAYLFGVVKRYKTLHDRSYAGGGAGGMPQGTTLSQPVTVSFRPGGGCVGFRREKRGAGFSPPRPTDNPGITFSFEKFDPNVPR